MHLNITKGRRAVPVRAIIYGPEGIGKSSLAAQFPEPLFLDTEDGTAQLDVSSVNCPNWDTLVAAVKNLADNPHGAKTIVIDSADRAERSMIAHILRKNKKDSIEDFGFGKGYVITAEHWGQFLALCDSLIASGLNVVFTGHSAVKRLSPPDQTDGYDRYELKLTKQVSPLLKEWSDLILFCNYKVQVVEGTDKRIKAVGGKERVMYSTYSAAWDAKNRYGLPDEIPMEFASIAHIFGGSGIRRTNIISGAAPAQESNTNTHQAPVTEQVPESLSTPDQQASLTAYSITKIGGPIIDRELARSGAVGVDELTEDQAAKTLAFISEKFAQATPAPTTKAAMPSKLAQWMEANEASVNPYLLRIKWVREGQTWRDLPPDTVVKIYDRFASFAKACGLTMDGRAA